MALTEEEKKEAIELYNKQKKLSQTSKKSGYVKPKMTKEEAAKSTKEQNEKVKQNAIEEKRIMAGRTDPNLYKVETNPKTEAKTEVVTPKKATTNVAGKAQQFSTFMDKPASLSAKVISSEAEKKPMSATQYGKTQLSNQIYDKYRTIEKYYNDPTGNSLEKGLFNRLRSAGGETVENIARIIDDNISDNPEERMFNSKFADFLNTNAKNVVAKNTAGQIGDLADQQIMQAKENTGNFGDFLIDTADAGANMASQAILAGVLLPGAPTPVANKVFSGVQGVSVGAQKYVDTREAGGNKAEAFQRGIGSGAIAAITEGLTGIGKTGVSKIPGVDKVVTRLDEFATKNWLTNVLSTALGEGGEEGLEYAFEYASDVIADLIYKGEIETDFNVAELFQNVASGFVLGAGFGSVGGTTNAYQNYTPKTETNVSVEAPVVPVEPPVIETENVTPKIQNAQEPVFANPIEKVPDPTVDDVPLSDEEIQANIDKLRKQIVKEDVRTENSPSTKTLREQFNEGKIDTPQYLINYAKEKGMPVKIEDGNFFMEVSVAAQDFVARPWRDIGADEVDADTMGQAIIELYDKVKDGSVPQNATYNQLAELAYRRALYLKRNVQNDTGVENKPQEQKNGAQGEGTRAQTSEPLVTPQENRAQKQNIDILLQNMDALGGEVGAQEGSFEGSGKKPTTQLSVKEILNSELTEREAKRYQDRVETINAYLEGGYKSLTPEQQNIYNKLGDYIPDYSKNSLVKKRDEYLKKLYGNSAKPKDITVPSKKEIAFPRLNNMKEEIFKGKKYTLEEINVLPEIQEAKKRANANGDVVSNVKFRDSKTGDWTPERKAVQDKIVNEIMNLGSAVIDEKGNVQYNGVVEQGRHADIVIGPPAAGKSTVFADPLSQQHKARIIDSDMVKERLPEFDGGYGANFVHEESASVADIDIKNRAVERGENVIFPLVGGKTAKIRKLIEFLRNEGYTVNLYYNEVPADVAMNRAFARFIQNGRFLPLDYVAGIYSNPNSNPTVTYYTLLKEGVADYYEHKSNDVPYGTKPPFVENPSGRDLYRPGNQGGVQDGRPIRQRGSSNGGNFPAGDRTTKESVKAEADVGNDDTGSFNVQKPIDVVSKNKGETDSVKSKTEELKAAPATPPMPPPDEPPKGPKDSDTPDVGIGARKSGENPVAQKAAQYGTYDVPKDSFTDYDDYVFRNEVSSADKKTLTETTIDYEGQTMPYSEAVVQMVMDEVKFSEQKGKYYADKTEIPKAAYDFGKNLEANGVKYWANKAEQFPTQWDDKNYVSRLVRNVASSKFGTNKTVELLEESLKNGRFIYERKHNKDTIEKAKNYITLHGVEESMKEWVNFANGNAKVSPGEILDKIALGTMLADVAFEVDDIDTATRILMDIAPWQTGMGQGIQFMSQLRKLGKDGNAPFKLTKSRAEYYVDRTLQTLNARYAGKLENKHIELPDELRQKWISSIGTDSEYEVTQEVFGNIANQIPASWFERFNSWRYFCMLCSPTTHSKNMTSNVAMSGATFVKDIFLSRLEANYQKKHPEYVKTASVFTNKADKAFAKETYDEANSKYGRGGTRYSYEDSNLESMRTNTFSGADYKFLKGLRKGVGKVTDKLVNSVSNLLEKEDTLTKKGIYTRKVAEIMKANGWTQEYFRSGTTQAIRDLEFAQQTAIEEAYKATFNNDNGVQKLLTSWRKMPDKTVSDKAKKYALGALVEITFPFKKVTANIPARAIEYSPIGIAQGILELKLNSKNEDFDAHQALEHIGAGAAGSSIALAGTLLGLLGIAQLTDGDENEDELKENRGWKNYSLKIGDYYLGLDDIAPVTTMLMGGVKLAQEIEELGQSYKDKDSIMEYVSACVGSLLEVAAFGIDGILQLDFFSSVKDLMTSYNNEESARGVFEEKLEGVAESLVGQVEPNILRKIMRTVEDDYANAYYYDKNEETPQWLQNIRSGAMLLVPDRKIEQLVYNKSGKKIDVPGYSDLAVRYDKWGRSINPEDFWVKAANNLISPFQISKEKSTPVDKELERLYESTKDKAVVPQTAKKYFTQDGKRIDMTAKQYSEYQKEYGQARYKNLEKLISSEYYKKLDDKNKALAVQAAYNLADDIAKDKIFEKPKDFYTDKPIARTGEYNEAVKGGLSPAAYIVSSAIYSDTQRTKTKSKDERFYNYLIADKTTSAKDDVLILEYVAGKDFDKYRSVTNDHQEILDIYDAEKREGGKSEDIGYLTDKFDGNELKAFALYSGSTASKKYENGELSGFGSKQLPKAQSLINEKGWTGENVAKAARTVTGLGDYLGKNRKTKANYIAVLKEVGFSEKEANEFYNVYGW